MIKFYAICFETGAFGSNWNLCFKVVFFFALVGWNSSQGDQPAGTFFPASSSLLPKIKLGPSHHSRAGLGKFRCGAPKICLQSGKNGQEMLVGTFSGGFISNPQPKNPNSAGTSTEGYRRRQLELERQTPASLNVFKPPLMGGT